MALIVVVGIWMFIGGSVYRAHKRAGLGPGDGATGGSSNVALGHRRVRAEIPDTVPSDWIDTYRAEHGG